MARLFDGNKSLTNMLINKKQDLEKEIYNLSDDQINNNDISEWEDYFIQKYQLDIINLDMNNITKSLDKTKIKKHNKFRSAYESEYLDLDGYKILYKIPFDGDGDLLYFQPNCHTLIALDVENIIKESNNNGFINYSIEYTENEARQKGPEDIEKDFNTNFKRYIDMIHYLNEELNEFNSSLIKIVKDNLYQRKQKAQQYISISEKLNIPLTKNLNAPNTIPVTLKLKKNLVMPTAKPKPLEYEISDEDYNNIKNIINLACCSFETSARTFNKLEEEELRDVILSNLNTHYKCLATGETFSKNGKTDIRIQFNNKAAYIGECKIWHGISQAKKALDQLFSYVTWRDSKVSLIIFNKNNKDFGKVLLEMEGFLKDNNINCLKKSRNEWQCIFNKPDTTEKISVQIVIYDISI